MLRTLSILTVLALLAGAVVGQKSDTKADGVLELTLPESAEPPDYAPERVSKLLIDGKDFSKPRSTKRTIAVNLKKGADSVKVEYTFWPNTYTRYIRTKTVKIEKGKTVKVDLRKD